MHARVCVLVRRGRKRDERGWRVGRPDSNQRERWEATSGGGRWSSTSFAAFKCLAALQHDSECHLGDVVVVVAVVDEGRALWEGGR